MSTFVALTDGFQIFRYPWRSENDDENSSWRRNGSISLLRCCLVMESPQNSVRYKPAPQNKLSASSYIQRFLQLRDWDVMRLWGYPPFVSKRLLAERWNPVFPVVLKHGFVWFFVPKNCREARCLKKFCIFMSVPNTLPFCSSDNHHHQLAQWLSPAFFGLDLCIHRDVPHRFHIVIRPTHSIETWSQMPMQMIPWINMMNTSLCHKILLAIVDVHKWEFASAPCESSNACVSVYASCHVIGSFSQVQVCTPDKIRRCLSANFRCSWAIGGGNASNTSTLHL